MVLVLDLTRRMRRRGVRSDSVRSFFFFLAVLKEVLILHSAGWPTAWPFTGGFGPAPTSGSSQSTKSSSAQTSSTSGISGTSVLVCKHLSNGHNQFFSIRVYNDELVLVFASFECQRSQQRHQLSTHCETPSIEIIRARPC